MVKARSSYKVQGQCTVSVSFGHWIFFSEMGIKKQKMRGYLISLLSQKWKNGKQNRFLFCSCISMCFWAPLKQFWLLTWIPAVQMKNKTFNIPIWILALEHIVKVTHQPEGCNYFWIISFVKIFTLIFKFKNLRKCWMYRSWKHYTAVLFRCYETSRC